MKNERNTNGNSTLAIGGVSSPLDNFVVAESSVFRINICDEIATFAKPENVTCHFRAAINQ